MRIGIADTTFSRVNMGGAAIAEIGDQAAIERYTVPGFKDLPVACKILFEKYNCDLVLAFGWTGKEEIDEVCAHEANQGLINVELIVNKHILKVFFHEKETSDLNEQKVVALDRARKHALNALKLLEGKEALTPAAGDGLRQGYNDAGGL
ncbi:MAG: riboflavin synthase [Nanoarchaeota archaeon]|nr:riboflavin synthase [Nanoarchaeota archaeon]MBU1622763.1 riboflavin synthase [Nanoarchaeota archaeon]